MFEQLTGKLESAFRRLRSQGTLNEESVREALREIRRAFLEADVNYNVAKDFARSVEARAAGREILKGLSPGQEVIRIVNEELTKLLGGEHRRLRKAAYPPTVIMAVGLQGSGKTSFCAKLALSLRKRKERVRLAACDVYRPAAIDQLETLAKQIAVPVHSDRGTTDVVGIADAAFDLARAEGSDFLILDTAGRLHIDDEMMDELRRLRDRVKPTETLLVVDGMTGQDAVQIAEHFNAKLSIDGVVLTKMDGDARGGAALSVRAVTGKPILFVATGEKPSDLEPFHPDRMASRILGMGDVLSLIERAEGAVDLERAERLAETLRKSEFTLSDFLEQLQQVRKMGPLEDIVKMIPGVGSRLKGVEMDPKALGRVEAIILSMTEKERRYPKIIDGSRRRRISRGSGTTVQEVNQVLRQFFEMNKMMKRFGKLPKRMRARLPFPI
jgi:signal recognition particle subunit SRP54